jgi:8-oxo-dGTP pyrophosphatase MutT (NUDIX family)
VAAVCYRLRGARMQFLLVRTRGGRWTFPKGCAEPGLTHAQAAALEAFEEAGVHGRMEEACFGRYVLRGENKAASDRRAVNAYLCGVSSQVLPEESKRNPTWFSPQDAKQRLREGRRSRDSAEFARVVDQAVFRINALPARRAVLPPDIQRRDALQRVPFEASEVPIYGRPQASFRGNSAAMELDVNAHLYRMWRLKFTQDPLPARLANKPGNQLLQSLNPLPAMAHVVEIDNPQGPPNKARISTRKTGRNRLTMGQS